MRNDPSFYNCPGGAPSFGIWCLPLLFCIGIAALPSSLLMGFLYQRFGAGPAFTTGASLGASQPPCCSSCSAPRLLRLERACEQSPTLDPYKGHCEDLRGRSTVFRGESGRLKRFGAKSDLLSLHHPWRWRNSRILCLMEIT